MARRFSWPVSAPSRPRSARWGTRISRCAAGRRRSPVVCRGQVPRRRRQNHGQRRARAAVERVAGGGAVRPAKTQRAHRGLRGQYHPLPGDRQAVADTHRRRHHQPGGLRASQSAGRLVPVAAAVRRCDQAAHQRSALTVQVVIIPYHTHVLQGNGSLMKIKAGIRRMAIVIQE